MTRVLYIVANPNPEPWSYGRKVAEGIVKDYQSAHPDHEIVVKDLYQSGVPLIDGAYLAARRALMAGSDLTFTEKAALDAIQREVDQFLSFDRYIIAVPMWNFGPPPLLKAYVDAVLVPGKTFSYTAQGPVGLLAGTGRKMIIVQSSGGVHSEGSTAGMNHCAPFLEDAFRFIGIEQVKTIAVEGTAIPGLSDQAVARAMSEARLALTEF